MKIIAFTKHNPKFEILNRPEEDSFKYVEKDGKIIIAVADGITRDLINGKYPIPSPAKKAADIFCKSFLEKQNFEYCNKKIAELNKNLKVDYLENDFAACVAVGGVIENTKLKYGFTSDCGVAVFDEKGILKFRTRDEGPAKYYKQRWNSEKMKGLTWEDDEARRLTRSEFRNNLDNPYSFGVFTGEDNAIKFVHTGNKKLNNKDYIIFYSDGFSSIIYSRKFNISREFNNLESYFDKNSNKIDGGEGTLVAVHLD